MIFGELGVTGLQRIGYVLLVGWWVWWGLQGQAAINELKQQGESYYLGRSAAESVLAGNYDEGIKREARRFLAARAAIKRAFIAAIVLPTMLIGAALAFRWIIRARWVRGKTFRD